jgi:hypothetical protein
VFAGWISIAIGYAAAGVRTETPAAAIKHADMEWMIDTA